jgi:copper(I)-binding protein
MKKLLLFLFLINSNVFAGDISVKNAYVRMLPPTSPATGVFMKIVNTSTKEIELIKASSSRSKKTEIHDHLKIDGMMKMREVKTIKVPAKGHVMLKPGSFHVMLIGLKTSLVLGEEIFIDLKFSNGEKISIKPKVKKIILHMNH